VLVGLAFLAGSPAGCGESSKRPAPAAPPDPTPGAPGAPPVSQSAADRYRALWSSWGDWSKAANFFNSEAAIPRMDTESDAARAAKAPAWNDFSRTLSSHQKEIGELLAISAEKTCDFKLRPTASPDDEFSSVGVGFRTAWRLLRADAGRCWQAGDMDGCVDRVAATFGMADHAAQQKILMTSLVGSAMVTGSCDAIKVFIEQSPAGAFKPAHARTLMQALHRIDRSDPCGLDAILRVEKATDPGLEAKIPMTRDRTRASLVDAEQLLNKFAK
jgi:hypothetical protein